MGILKRKVWLVLTKNREIAIAYALSDMTWPHMYILLLIARDRIANHHVMVLLS